MCTAQEALSRIWAKEGAAEGTVANWQHCVFFLRVLILCLSERLSRHPQQHRARQVPNTCWGDFQPPRLATVTGLMP